MPVRPDETADVDELTDRAREWASTMAGHDDRFGAVRPPTPTPTPGPAPSTIADRDRPGGPRRRLPRARRHPVRGAGDRAVDEEPDPWRTCFERDRDRIVHGTAFRRLAGKTQVFVHPADHQRTRLTHALEVAQVAVSVARACRLNVALTEAIALGHDCGHGPFGHASEDALAPFVDGGYDHATWGADVVLEPLNLCAETLDGIRNHSWSRPAPATPEGEVVSWADRIAYLCHDFEDAVHAGVVDADELPGDRRRAVRHRPDVCSCTPSSRPWSARPRRLAWSAWTPPTPRPSARSGTFNYQRIYLRPESRAQATHRRPPARRPGRVVPGRPDPLVAAGRPLPDRRRPDPGGGGLRRRHDRPLRPGSGRRASRVGAGGAPGRPGHPRPLTPRVTGHPARMVHMHQGDRRD